MTITMKQLLNSLKILDKNMKASMKKRKTNNKSLFTAINKSKITLIQFLK
jgi:hypothetical protein